MNRSKRRAFERQAKLHPTHRPIEGRNRWTGPPGLAALVSARIAAGWWYRAERDWVEPPDGCSMCPVCGMFEPEHNRVEPTQFQIDIRRVRELLADCWSTENDFVGAVRQACSL